MEKIKLENVTFSYDNTVKVLDNLSLSFDSGKFYVILGHNGSGKSTIAKLIAGLLDFKVGSIYIDGEQINAKNIARIRQKIGIVFQNPDNQFIGSTVKDDIAFGLENRRVRQEDMEDIILRSAQKVKMEQFLDKEPSQLSGGQKQRVAIAGIIALNPEIIIFDESTSMLDPLGRSEVNDLIKQMRKDNPSLTIILITHDIEEALTADELIIINNGKVVKQGNPLNIFYQTNLQQFDLDYPLHVKLVKALASVGINLGECSYEQMVEQLCQLKVSK